MSLKKSTKYKFKNDLLSYESFINEFTPEHFKEYNLKAEKLKLKSKIEELIHGKEVNETENQAAWHPKYRKNTAKNSSNQFSIIKSRVYDLINKYKNSHSKSTTVPRINIITIGIGGSYEGPKLLAESLNEPLRNNGFNLKFISGSDPIEFVHTTKQLNPEETIFIISSKSFTTQETIETMKLAMQWSSDINKFIAITANNNEAKKYNFNDKNIITFDKEIGGRYSIWTCVAEATTFSFVKEKEKSEPFLSFSKGGYASDKDILNNEEYFEFLKFLSFSDIWLHNSKGKNIRAVLSYIWLFRSLPNYIQQLEMESLGKPAYTESEFHKTGQIIFGGYGPRAQHSYFQLLHQGTHQVCADIIASRENQKNLAYAQALTQSKLLSQGSRKLKKVEKINGNVPTNLFILNKVDSYSLGYLISSWEHRTFITAKMLGINPFDQFGVNAGKIYTKKYLADKK